MVSLKLFYLMYERSHCTHARAHGIIVALSLRSLLTTSDNERAISKCLPIENNEINLNYIFDLTRLTQFMREFISTHC
jgi:hypothetical protein